MKQAVEGMLISADADQIVMDEGDAIATYSTKYYRLPLDMGTKEPIAITRTDPLLVEMMLGPLGHGALASV